MTTARQMPGRVGRIAAFARLELSDALRSKWAALSTVVYGALVLAFVWLGLGESSVLGFTGLSRVLLNVAHAVLVVFPLLALFASHAAVVRARSSGLLELLLVQPAARAEWFVAAVGARLLVLLGPLSLVLLSCGIAAAVLGAEPGLLAIAVRSAAISVSLVCCFVGVGFFVSAHARTPERALVLALVVWLCSTALLDAALIAVLLRTSLPPQVVFFVSVLNPGEAARVGLLSAVDPELSVLGPVGFWLANTLGARITLAIAVVWPLLIGLVASLLAARRLQRGDVVG